MKKRFFLQATVMGFIGLLIAGCSGQSKSNQNRILQDTLISAQQLTEVKTAPQDSIQTDVLLHVNDTVAGRDVQHHDFETPRKGNYTILMTSSNPGTMFVVLDQEGNNVVPESSGSWSGELNQGKYTIIAGLTRNAARKPGANAIYSIEVQ